MEQLEFDFMSRRYDIFSDSMVPITANDMNTLRQVYNAYGQVRMACMMTQQAVPKMMLEAIHRDLKARLVVTNRPSTNDRN